MAQKPEQTPTDEVQTEATPQPSKDGQSDRAYEPAPRGAARIGDIDLAAIDARLSECGAYFSKHCDEADYRNLDWYGWRMQLRFAAGDDIYEVVDDAFMAARCLHERHAMHLELKPPEMFMTRRIMPVELGIISGMPMLTLEFSATYGLPLMMVLGNTAPEDVMGEANLMTSYFRRGFCADFAELTGLSAVIYAGAIAAIGRGFDDEATLGINTYAKARDSLRGKPPASLLPKIMRYDALIAALACLCAGNFGMIGDILAPEAEAFEAEQRRRCGENYASPSKMPPPKYFDTAILTILALTALRGETLRLPETGAIAAYRDFEKGLTEIPERRIEVPGLDEESRRILQEAGIDPDNIGGNEADKSFRNAKEESEARAAEIFEEKQRLAQAAVREKLARGVAQAADAADAQSGSRPPHEAEDGKEAPRSYDNFFAGDDDDAAQRRFNEESEAAPEEDAKSFDRFFESGGGDPDADRIQAANDAEDSPAPRQTKDFSSFFDQDDETDASLRAHAEEDAAAAQDTGKSYASFFDTLDEAAIPKYDDGSQDAGAERASAARSFSDDFFSEDRRPPSGLKMTPDPDPQPRPEAPKPEEKAKAVCAPTIEDNSPRRDFAKLFDESVPAPTIGLKMSDDAEENAKCYRNALEHDKTGESFSDNSAPYGSEEAPKRDFSKLFDESIPAPTIGLKMSDDAEENAKCYRNAAERGETVSDDRASHEPGGAQAPARDFKRFFEDEAPAAKVTADDAARSRADQIRELESAQAEKAKRAAEEKEKRALKLKSDGSEPPEIKKAESYQERMARLNAEKHEAARAQALLEREAAMKELEAWKKSAPKTAPAARLQMTPDAPRDPDDIAKKADPEDLVIKGFAYDELDMIRANTAQKAETEEDFDLYAALSKTKNEDAAKDD